MNRLSDLVEWLGDLIWSAVFWVYGKRAARHLKATRSVEDVQLPADAAKVRTAILRRARGGR